MKSFLLLVLFLSSPLAAQSNSSPSPNDAKSLLQYYASTSDSVASQARVYYAAGAAMQIESVLAAKEPLSSEAQRYSLLAACWNRSLHRTALNDSALWLAANSDDSESAAYANVVGIHEFLDEKVRQEGSIARATKTFAISLAGFVLAFVLIFRRYVQT
jgi:hypothetical protein